MKRQKERGREDDNAMGALLYCMNYSFFNAFRFLFHYTNSDHLNMVGYDFLDHLSISKVQKEARIKCMYEKQKYRGCVLYGFKNWSSLTLLLYRGSI